MNPRSAHRECIFYLEIVYRLIFLFFVTLVIVYQKQCKENLMIMSTVHAFSLSALDQICKDSPSLGDYSPNSLNIHRTVMHII